MKNLIYTICNDAYSEVLKIWKTNIQKYNNIDTLVICPKTFICSDDLLIHKLDNFDYKYTSKFVINDYEQVSEYDNFLYLDSDIICLDNIHRLFEKINDNKNIIHGVKEGECLRNTDYFHRFMDIDPNSIDIAYHAYNAGTFGFNKNMLPIFKEYIDYTNQNLKHYCDQPIFNMFFNAKKLIQPTLSEFVYLKNSGDPRPPDINYPLIHFTGLYGDNLHKIRTMTQFINK